MLFIQQCRLIGFAISLAGNIALSSHAWATSVGELELSAAGISQHNALLISTAISGEVEGMIASITIDQQFKNSSDDWVHGRYVFPLPEGAAVDSLKITIGERVIKGVVKSKAEAKKTFEEAKKTGKKAGLLSQHRPNLFSMSVANIGPRELVTAKITFINKVAYQDGVFSLTLPTTLTPRYIPGAPIKLTTAQEEALQAQLVSKGELPVSGFSGWASNTDQVPDANTISPPQIYTLSNQSSHHFSLALSINAGLDLQHIISDTHAIVEHSLAQHQTLVSLANVTEPMHKDLELRWLAMVGATPQAAVFQQSFAGAHYTMMMLSPPDVDAQLSLPRDTTFIIDSSGSMAGGSMVQAKQALLDGLSHLNSSDRFNVIDFDSDFRALYESSRAASPTNVAHARSMVNSLVADGGTEMMGALRFAMRPSDNTAYLRQIIFITDGAIGNETELFKLIRSQLGSARLFTIGIGSAPNSYFMSKAAEHGRGSYSYIRHINQVQNKMAELFAKISKPQMRDIELDWGAEVEQFPSRIPDLYAGEPISVLVKSVAPLDRVAANGKLLGQSWQQVLKLGKSKNEDAQANNLDTVWARAKVSDLMDKLALREVELSEAKQQITQLGISHSIVTKYTSLVAVDATPSKPDHLNAKHKNVTNLMPSGSTMPIPQTATPALLMNLLGGLLILLSGVLKRRQRCKSSKLGLEA